MNTKNEAPPLEASFIIYIALNFNFHLPNLKRLKHLNHLQPTRLLVYSYTRQLKTLSTFNFQLNKSLHHHLFLEIHVSANELHNQHLAGNSVHAYLCMHTAGIAHCLLGNHTS